MATQTFNFPGFYIDRYDFTPNLGDFLAVSFSPLSSGGTQQTLMADLPNGVILKLNGTDFTYDTANRGAGGTLTSIQLFHHDGITPIMEVAGLNINFNDFWAGLVHAQASGSSWIFAQWIMTSEDFLGGQGNDSINGADGDDFVEGNDGQDTFDGGAGFDELSFNDANFDAGALIGFPDVVHMGV